VTLQQAGDFRDESAALYDVLAELGDDQWDTPTQFKGWTINDVIVHLHFWNQMVDLSLKDPAGFMAKVAQILPKFAGFGMRAAENETVTERGPALREAWRGLYEDIGAGWADLDPKHRVKWVGPDMSVRSSMTARQMETWAHGQEIFDILGKARQDADRVRNIVMLGVNTFGWSYKVNGRDVPEKMPYLELIAPSGDVWTYGEEDSGNQISGRAVEFAQVVAQTRNIADTTLSVTGPVAQDWMSIAQCFAGPPETPPEPGLRHKAGG
jgi:uncharacterized protein (TIGR03084 family)